MTTHWNRVPMKERRQEKFACCYEHQGQTEAPGDFPKGEDESVSALTFYWGYFFRPILFQGEQVLRTGRTRTPGTQPHCPSHT